MTDEELKNDVAAEPQQAQEVTEPTETSEEAQDRVLMELDGEPDADDLIESGGASEESGPAVEQRGDPEESEAPPLSEEREQAYDVLRRDGWTLEDLEALPAERLLSIAEHRRKVQADVDRKLRERQAQQDDTETGKDSEAGQAEPTKDQPSVANLREQAKAFGEYLGLDESGQDLLVELQQAAVQPMQKLIDDQRQALEAVQQQLLFTELERARVSLEDQYPQARDTEDERWGKVLDRMGKMWNEGSELGTRQLMEEAILLEYRGELASEAKQSRDRVASLRQTGMPTARPRPEATPVYSTPEERQDAVLKILESNDPDKYARARAIGKPNL